jgi:hypothetical protein
MESIRNEEFGVKMLTYCEEGNTWPTEAKTRFAEKTAQRNKKETVARNANTTAAHVLCGTVRMGSRKIGN